jgi:hypothetical protein
VRKGSEDVPSWGRSLYSYRVPALRNFINCLGVLLHVFSKVVGMAQGGAGNVVGDCRCVCTPWLTRTNRQKLVPATARGAIWLTYAAGGA